MSLLAKSAEVRIFHFRASQSGERYFHGWCEDVHADDASVTFIGRRIPRYFFKSGEHTAQVEVIKPGSLTLLRTDFHMIVTEVLPPRWFYAEELP